MKTAYQQRIRDLLDQERPLTPDEEWTLFKMTPLGMGPLLPEPVKRQPYDSLYVKQKYTRDYWSNN